MNGAPGRRIFEIETWIQGGRSRGIRDKGILGIQVGGSRGIHGVQHTQLTASKSVV
jgi:hypothetical protein